MEKIKKNWTKAALLLKLQAYCAYQERCMQEVKTKLYDLGATDADLQQSIMDVLIDDNFLNEQRFAQAFAGGKFRLQQWGKVRIELELRKRQISDKWIQKALASIEGSEYLHTFQQLLERKRREYPNTAQGKANLAAYLFRKGYEPELVWQWLPIENL